MNVPVDDTSPLAKHVSLFLGYITGADSKNDIRFVRLDLVFG